MKNNFFSIYDSILDSMGQSGVVTNAVSGDFWSMIETSSGIGVAMTTAGDSIAPMYPDGFLGLELNEAAKAVKSWNMAEAGFGLAAANCFFNTPERMDELGCYEPFENYCTAGLDFCGKTVGMIGHMHGPESLRREAKAIHIIERAPQPGDYPDSACDYILPQCDIVLITGSSLVNKTLPHLLELCRDAYTIVTGPSVPMCPALLEHGIDRIAGMVVTVRDEMCRQVFENRPGSPYCHGRPFLIKK